MLELKVDVKADSRYPVNRKAIRASVKKVLEEKEVSGKVYVSVIVVGDRKMRDLNRSYRKLDKTTDVLSFPTDDPSQDMDMHGFVEAKEAGIVLGDIVVSFPEARRQAVSKNELLDNVVCFLVEHGMLHLLGIHHD